MYNNKLKIENNMEELELVIIGDKVWMSSVELARVYNRKHYAIISKIDKLIEADSSDTLNKYIKKREFDIGGYYYIISCTGFSMIGGHFNPKFTGYKLISKMLDFKKENDINRLPINFPDALRVAYNKAIFDERK